MLSLIKMDLYRLFHSRMFKVGLICSVIVAFLSMLLSFGVIELIKLAMEDSPMEDISDMATIFPMLSWMGGADFADIVIYGTGSLSLFIGCMVSATFISSEQSCGYTKNIAGQIPNKSLLILSKFIVTSLIYLGILLIYAIISIACTFMFFSKYINAYSVGHLVAMLGLRYLLFVAVNAVVVFLCTLTKSQSFAMIYGAILGIGATGLVYLAINSLLSMIKIEINISKFMPDGINGLLTVAEVGNVYLRAIIVSVVFIATFITLSAIIVKKRDVK